MQKLKAKLQRLEKQLETVRGKQYALPVGSMARARVSRKWDGLAKEKFAVLQAIENWKPSLKDWADRLKLVKPTCACTQRGKNMESRVKLGSLVVEHWGPHDGGWQVAGYEERRWLYVTCPKCNHQYSFASLGLPKEESRYEGKIILRQTLDL